MNIAEKQAKWKRQETRLEKQAKRSEANQCREKFVHPNFLSAMKHARHLTAKTGKLYTPYVCLTCGEQHVGAANGGGPVTWMFDGESFRAEA